MGETYIYMLSGGVNPTSNHYSQYLQAQAVNQYRVSHGLPGMVQFGAGYQPGASAEMLHDVQQVVVVDGVRQTQYIQGEIPNNRPATATEVQAVFGEITALPVGSIDHFVLFVGDHGSPNSTDLSCFDFSADDDFDLIKRQNYSDSLINLWNPTYSFFPERDSLGVQELDADLQAALPKNVPVAVVMTQCYSGGFHRMAYTFDSNGLPVKDDTQNVVVFTSIHRKTTAAGCTPYVENDRYDGYERRIVEALTGINVITGEKLTDGEPAILAAHMSASLMDRTKDTPLRTSEAFSLDYYEALQSGEKIKDADLEELWKNFKSQDFGKLAHNDVLLREANRRLTHMRDLEKQIKKWFPELKNEDLLASLSHVRNAMKIAQTLESANDKEAESVNKEIKKDFVPMKVAYVEAVKNGELGPEVYEFERLNLLANGEDYRFFAEDPTLIDLAKYKNYLAHRDETILLWASKQEKFSGQVQGVREKLDHKAMLENRSGEFEIQYACLQRLEQQMIVATLDMWWITQDDKLSKQAIQDREEFIVAEEAAMFI